VFPQATVKGCSFHFRQALYRRVQREGLKSVYDEAQAQPGAARRPRPVHITSHYRHQRRCVNRPPISQDEENVKVTHRHREQGAALHCLSQQLPGTQQDTGCHLQQMHHAITWCAPNSDILTTLYFICVRMKLHCKSSAMHNFNLIIYHLSHVDPTRPDPTSGSGQQSCNSVPAYGRQTVPDRGMVTSRDPV